MDIFTCLRYVIASRAARTRATRRGGSPPVLQLEEAAAEAEGEEERRALCSLRVGSGAPANERALALE